jgi:hypothetical protein
MYEESLAPERDMLPPRTARIRQGDGDLAMSSLQHLTHGSARILNQVKAIGGWILTGQ